MSYFKNTVEINYDTRVITNPENRITINGNVTQLGTKYILFRTVWNRIKHAARSFFQW